jgi:L-histidine N-alpha-methyltransferase
VSSSAPGRGPGAGDRSQPLSIEVHLGPEDLQATLEKEALEGLCRSPKGIPPKWFYDEEGSRLFEEITTLPEYYPTRAERRLLVQHADAIAAVTGADTLVELGAGSCAKTRLLLDAISRTRPLERYLPFDVSAEYLRAAASELTAEYPGLRVHAIVGDFHLHLGCIPEGGNRLVAFLGGTIGNLTPAERERFFFDLNCVMAHDDHLLLGTDLVKEPSRIVAAYDDSAGVTAAFNRNVLAVMNHRLGADFHPDRFDHVAVWNPTEEWIEMRLRSATRQSVSVPRLALTVDFEDGEEMLTEISAKFTPERIEKELFESGFVVDAMWGAEEGEFLLTVAHPYC